MNVSRISDKVHYIGVNDRTTTRFEALWPLPFGVSYNSYLICGKKTAIIDGVETAHALRHIDHIRAITNGRHPDYLIINHMEPDHSGAIRILREAFPDITIVGNSITLSMIEGFYGVTDNTIEVRDGHSLSLGCGVTLTFAMTPMVHWPETMMTYFAEERMLFSGDAFGCFGALNGAVIDSDMETAPYIPEMIRYYSNIVGKYGQHVQRALSKLASLPVDTICPTHGPVWRDRTSDITGLYDIMSRYEPLDNGATIVYGSMYGNTESMAEAAAEGLASGGVRNIAVHNASVSDLSYIIADIFRHRGLIIASPTYSATLFPPVRAVMEAIAVRGIRNRHLALLGSYTWAQQALKIMEQYAGECGMTTVAPSVNVKQSPTSQQIAQCRETGLTMARMLNDRKP